LDIKTKRIALMAEFVALYICLPLLLFATGTRLGIYLTLWGAGLYAFFMLRRMPGFSWQKLWHGDGWSEAAKRKALLRFIGLAAVLGALTFFCLPERFLSFPIQRFPLWCAVMALYPLLSIVPQELFFRSFYFARYQGAVTERLSGILANGLVFGFSHIVLNNWVAPSFCAVGGLIFAQSYQQHHSLKWAVIEHTLYGNWIFTVGIGYYFFTGNWRP
jgi:uncharacterized protein